MTTYSNILAWEIPWTEEPGGLQSMCAKSLQLCPSLWDPMDCPRVFCPWDSPGKNTGVDCHALLQRIFPTQELNPTSLKSPALAGGFFTTSTTREALGTVIPPLLTCDMFISSLFLCVHSLKK